MSLTIFIDTKIKSPLLHVNCDDWCLLIEAQYSTTLLCLCREICSLARHLQETFNAFYNKKFNNSTKLKLKTAQIQKQYITLTMFIQTHKYVCVVCTHTHEYVHTRICVCKNTHTHSCACTQRVNCHGQILHTIIIG